MFEKILIANRGEIACRVIKTARTMGLKTVAVFSDADRGALHVALANEAIHIGPPAATQSYLRIGKIVEAAQQTGAQAVHPGYGFLSENPKFARALQKAGIVFIGPNVKAIEVMGDKIQSKRFANDAKVNTVPGYLGVIEDEGEAVEIADDIGYPVMIKASAGGGGKGMRIANSPDEVVQGFASSVSEAKSSFGDGRVFIEKFIENPRHIEIQVLGDSHGAAIYLGERECSIQRRSQKVIEEAPSPLLDKKTRTAMGEQAVVLARAVGYESAGTVEFIVDKEKNFFFLEMNTRLQVEHPVTELVTGVDLVEQMIRIAAGEKLKLTQKDIRIKGWAVESRIYAEDPFRNFLPSTGRLVRYQPPQEATSQGLTIRNDTGVAEGGEISIYYDPMIAKLITYGPNREAAIDHMARALDAFYIDGIEHNIPFLTAVMQNERWRKGDLTTAFIDEEYPEGFEAREPSAEERILLAFVAVAIDHMGNERRRKISQQMEGNRVQFALKRVVQLGAEMVELTVIDGNDAGLEVALLGRGGKVRQRTIVETDWWFGEPIWFGRIDGAEIAVQVRPIRNGFDLVYRDVHVGARVYTLREAELAALMLHKEPPDTTNMLLCPMPGLVVSIAVKEGDEVKTGDPLCVIEAMKMENILLAQRNARVASIEATPGDILAVDAVIIRFD